MSLPGSSQTVVDGSLSASHFPVVRRTWIANYQRNRSSSHFSTDAPVSEHSLPRLDAKPLGPTLGHQYANLSQLLGEASLAIVDLGLIIDNTLFL